LQYVLTESATFGEKEEWLLEAGSPSYNALYLRAIEQQDLELTQRLASYDIRYHEPRFSSRERSHITLFQEKMAQDESFRPFAQAFSQLLTTVEMTHTLRKIVNRHHDEFY